MDVMEANLFSLVSIRSSALLGAYRFADTRLCV
jgi:hypothetical protein